MTDRGAPWGSPAESAEDWTLAPAVVDATALDGSHALSLLAHELDAP